MPIWVFFIVLASFAMGAGGMYIEHQKNKMNMMNRSQQNEEEVEDVRKLVNALKTRIENLEAIAAGEPDDFKAGAGAGMSEIEIEETDPKEENKQQVSDIANKQRS